MNTTSKFRKLTESELEAVSGGFIGETVSNNSSPPASRSETASNSGPGYGATGCLRSMTTETTSRSGYCTAQEM
jgi:bacteriocin-like protein